MRHESGMGKCSASVRYRRGEPALGFTPIRAVRQRALDTNGGRVHLRRFKLNGQLAHHLRDHATANGGASRPSSRFLPSYHVARWRLRDRLTPQDFADLVALQV